MDTLAIHWVYNDGGRKASGFVKESNKDCVCRAIAIATELPYSKVYKDLNELAKRERKSKNKKHKSSSEKGVYKGTYTRYLKSLGWQFHATVKIGTGCKVHLKAEELPKGNLIARVSKHMVAVKDGIIHDTYDCSRNGTRCVYGYWSKV